MSEQAYCAHRNIQYAPDVRNEGTRDEWRCIICETPFVPQPKPIVTAPTSDAVAQAREAVLLFTSAANVDVLIAAVEARCTADTKRLNWLEAFGKSGTGLYAESNASHFDWSQGSLRAAIDHAMQEAQP